MRFSAEEAAEECRLIRNVELWPMWPWLPMKNYDKEPTGLGMMHASDLTKVYLVTLFEAGDTDFSTAPAEEFESVEALVDAGWMGD